MNREQVDDASLQLPLGTLLFTSVAEACSTILPRALLDIFLTLSRLAEKKLSLPTTAVYITVDVHRLTEKRTLNACDGTGGGLYTENTKTLAQLSELSSYR